MRVYIGYDSREQAAFAVAAKTAGEYGIEVVPLYESRLRAAGLLTRPMDRRDGIYDLTSNEPQSTEFALSRFFVPILAHTGWALFADCDVVFMQDPHELMALRDPAKAVQVVKHPRYELSKMKMDGQVQKDYPRKLWSSVMLFNCDHAGNKRLNLMMLNQWPRKDLHGFGWLADSEIGELPAEANWLVGMQPKPARPMVAHFTLGTPDMPGLENCDYADIWLSKVSER